MDIQLEKLELIKMLVETDDQSIIASVKKIFSSNKKDFGRNYLRNKEMKLKNLTDKLIEVSLFFLKML